MGKRAECLQVKVCPVKLALFPHIHLYALHEYLMGTCLLKLALIAHHKFGPKFDTNSPTVD